jgi:hypothetical protein
VVGATGTESAVPEAWLVLTAGDRGTDHRIRRDQLLGPGEFGPPPVILPADPEPFSLPRAQIAGVAVAVAVQSTVPDLDDVPGETVEEGTVVADDDQGTAVSVELTLQPVHGLIVQVIGWFVEQQQIGAGAQGRGQCQPRAFTTGEIGDRTGPVQRAETELVKGDVQAVVEGEAAP